MAELSPGAIVSILNPSVTMGLWLKEGPTGPAGPQGAQGDPGATGLPGDDGVSIVSVVRTAGTGAPGTTDTYTITYSDTTTSTFNVYNGANGTGTGDVVGPAGATADHLAVFDTATGKLIKDGGVTVAGLQPADADLTAISALTTTAFGRALLELADAATARATLLAAASVGGGREKSAALSATTGTCTGDLSAASIFTVTPTGNITLAFSNVPATGTACTVTVIVTQGGTVRTVAPPTGTKWMGAAAPTQVANKVCAFTFLTVDGGTTWYASAAVEQ